MIIVGMVSMLLSWLPVAASRHATAHNVIAAIIANNSLLIIADGLMQRYCKPSGMQNKRE